MPNENGTKGHRVTGYVSGIVVFLFFTLVFLAVNFSGRELSSFDDPGYHLAHALSYKEGWVWQNPVFSTLSLRPADLYVGYHQLLSLVYTSFGAESLDDLIVGTKVTHSILSAFFFTLFFIVLRSMMLREENRYHRIGYAAFIAVALLFFLSPQFTFRLILYRPHIFSIIFVLLAFYCCVRRRYLLLAAVSFLVPFFYSISFLVLVPPFVAVIAALWYELGTGGVFEKMRSTGSVAGAARVLVGKNLLEANARSRAACYSLLTACAGLIAGIIARPDSLNYLYNAYVVHLIAVFNFLFRHVSEGSELAPATSGGIVSLAFMLSFVVVTFFYYIRIYELGISRAISRERFFLFLLAQAFFVLMVVIGRAVEYAVPFVSLFMFVVIFNSILPFLKKVRNGDFRTRVQNPVTVELLRAAQTLLDTAFGYRTILARVLIVIGGFYFVTMALSMVFYIRIQPPRDAYQGAADFMREHSSPGDLVFQQRFDVFPRLVLFNHFNHYSAGMGNVFMYLYDTELYWLWQHVVNGEAACPTRLCVADSTVDPYEVIKERFNARYIFIDATDRMGEYTIDNNQAFIDMVENDSRYRKVYTDPKYPLIGVYEL